MAISNYAQKILDTILKNYTICLCYDPTPEADDYFVYIKEWGGCMSQGNSIEEAVEMICDAAKLWYDSCIEDGLSIPPPYNYDTDPSVWDSEK